MANIKQHSIQLVKESLRISDVFEWLGAKVQRRGAQVMAWCPFCEDANSKSPGCSLSDDKGLFHCFTADTKIITSQGVKTISDVLGAPVSILNGDGEWEEVEFHSYGEQEIWRLVISDNGTNRAIMTTNGHRWPLSKKNEIKTTEELMSGDSLQKVFPRTSKIASPSDCDVKVVSATDTEHTEEVFCCQTSTSTFALDGYILTGNCFVCQESGDVITAVMEHESLNFKEAVELLAENFNIPLEYDESGDPEVASRRKRLSEVLEAAQDEFIAQRTDPHYTEFLTSRNITEDVADKFGLGISLMDKSDEVVNRLLERFTQQDLIDAGLCYMSEHTNKLELGFKNRLMFPIKTASGTLVAFGGRDLTGKSKAKYKNSPETEIFKKRDVLYGMDVSKRAMNKSGRVIVCEGYMDTIALQTHGFEYAVGAMGTALTQYNLNRIGRFASQIYISLDSDEAGIRAAMRTAEVMPEGFNSDIKVLVIPEVQCNNEEEVRKTSLAKADEYLYKTVPVNPVYPDGEKQKVPVEFPVMVPMAKDPDEFFNQVGHTPEEFEKIVEDAPDLFLFCVMMLTRDSIAAIDEEIQKDSPNQEVVAHAKIKARRDVDDFMVKVYAKTNIYQRRQIASWLISAARLLDTENKLENDWTQRAVTSGAFDKNKSQLHPQKSKVANTVFTNKATREEDLLIATLYYHPSCRQTVKENIEDIKLVFTSPEREAIFMKLDEGYGKGLSAKDATVDLTENQTRELSRIVMEAEGHDEEISDNAVKKICKQIEAHALENKIEQESNAAEQDIMSIIELKTKLAAMKTEIEQMK